MSMRAFALVILPALTATVASAQKWINPAGGNFNDPSNWHNNTVPDGSDGADFPLAATYTVNLTEDAIINACHFHFGDVTMNLAGSRLVVLGNSSSNPSLKIGVDYFEDAKLTLQGGRIIGVNMGVSDNGNSNLNRPRGAVTLTGPTTRLECERIWIGRTGIGTLDVNDGATAVAISTVIGAIPGSDGSVVVTDTGSKLTFQAITIGAEGRGRLLIDGSAVVETTGAMIANVPGADALAVIRGAGSRWTNHAGQFSEFNLGYQSIGAVMVLDGGVLQCAQVVRIWPNGLLAGDSLVDGDVENQGRITPGGGYEQTTGSLIASGVGELTVSGDTTTLESGRLDIEVSGNAIGQVDRLSVSGSLALEGTLAASLLDGFVPAPGDEFVVASATSVAGRFVAFDLVDLGLDRSWAVVYQADSVVLTVNPWPHCPADMDYSGFVDLEDYGAFVLAFERGIDYADFDGSGFVDIEDFSAFVGAFESGC